MCKKSLCALFIGGLLAGGMSSAFATDTGTVTFNGKIIDDTCDVTVNSTDANGTVTFKDVYPSAFTADDSVGDSQTFDIALTGCDTNIDKINLKFNGTTVTSKTSVLKTTGVATNVGVRLVNWAGADVLFDNSEPASTSDKTVKGTGAATFTYTAKVVQVGSVKPTAGDYTAQATYTLLYR
ncbi:fimbrial protein [Enterobacter cloacae complex sp. 2024EL-00215]|uniref:fimbrial protein n=1 Tax=Enterobacter TaxID=547 RepID=UPI0015F6C0D2|nr:fimbrial protein [Enterobacter sp. RHBSTW-00901]MBA7853770.1 type 1 fimbrial protein [Enterobacter sp. RHBSTW-00901]